jgi:hypothetical protein
VFNICSNKANTFDQNTLEYFYEVSQAAYNAIECRPIFFASANPSYWKELYSKFLAIHREIQDASKSLNKSFGTWDNNFYFVRISLDSHTKIVDAP